MATGKKTGGRQRGTPNKATKDVRGAIAKLAENLIGEVEDWIRDIEDPAKRVDCITRMIEYHIPKLSRSELTGDAGKPIEVTIVKFGER